MWDLSLFQGCSSYLDLRLWRYNGIPIQAPIWWVHCQHFWLVPFLLCNPSLKELKYQRLHLRFAACPSISKSAFSVVKISPSFVSRKSYHEMPIFSSFQFPAIVSTVESGMVKSSVQNFHVLLSPQNNITGLFCSCAVACCDHINIVVKSFGCSVGIHFTNFLWHFQASSWLCEMEFDDGVIP